MRRSGEGKEEGQNGGNQAGTFHDGLFLGGNGGCLSRGRALRKGEAPEE